METTTATWLEEAKENAGRLMFFGVIEIIAGALAIMSPLFAGVTVAVFVGIALLIGGVARLFGAFMADSFGSGTLSFLWGLILAGTGFYFLVHPGLGLAALTMILAVVFFINGLTQIAISLKMKPVSGWGWMLTGGILSILLAIMIWQQYPLSGTWAVGTFVGINLLFNGFSTVSLGSVAKKAAA